jgi:hypothetical protein
MALILRGVFKRLGDRLEFQGDSIHSVALPSRLGPVVEHVAEMTAAAPAMHFRSCNRSRCGQRPQARIAEIMAVGAERAEVTAEEVIRELKKLGFSCIGKAVTWRNEVVTQELEGGDGFGFAGISQL